MSFFTDQEASFDLHDSAQIIDELFKVFQYIDKDSTGQLSVEAIAAF